MSFADQSFQPEQALQLSWEQNALAWTDVVRDQGIESRRLVTDDAIVQAALRVCSERKSVKVLDLGCGEGWLTRRLCAEGLPVTGCDGSVELIQQAQALNESLSESPTGKQAHYLCLSYDTLSLEPAQAGSDYDLIIANFALLSEDLAPLLSALRQISVKNAHLLIQTLHPFNAGEPYCNGWRREDFTGFGDPEQNNWTPMPWYFRTVSGWLQLLQDAGWQLKHLAEPVDRKSTV